MSREPKAMNNEVVLVNEEDQELGVAEVGDAHMSPGMLHRAISILLYRIIEGKINLLICRRSLEKTRWPGFWTNPVCTHPQPGEGYTETCVRRLKEELGIRVPKKALHFLFRFSYQAPYNEMVSEHELDSVYIAERRGKLYPAAEEISDYKWVTLRELLADMSSNPKTYTPWFFEIVKRQELAHFLEQRAVL